MRWDETEAAVWIANGQRKLSIGALIRVMQSGERIGVAVGMEAARAVNGERGRAAPKYFVLLL